MDNHTIYMTNLSAVGVMMLLGWLVSLLRRDVSIVDTLWGLGFILIAWLTWFQTDGYGGRSLLVAVLTSLWGLRLSIYMARRNHGKGEDPRYAQWRRLSSTDFRITSLFKVFLLQAIFLWVIALTIQAGQLTPPSVSLGVWDIMGALIWLLGFVFESVGDRQLARFKARPENRDRVMDRGLWRYSRHPNYFGESLVWWGLWIIAVSHPPNWWTVVSPVVITLVLLKMTGIPLTEKLLLEKRPDYLEYMEKTPAFFPWLPRVAKSSRTSPP